MEATGTGHPTPTSTPSPVPSVSHISKNGQDVLWTAYAIFVLATLLIAILTTQIYVKHRAIHLIALVVNGVAALSYFAMATHSGVSYVSLGLRTIQGKKTIVLRQVFWARYIHWAITTPLIFFVLALIAGLPWLDVVLLMVIVGAIISSVIPGALLCSHKVVKLGWYAHTCFWIILVFVVILGRARQCAKQQRAPVRRLYTPLTFYVTLLAFGYAVILGLGESSGVISVSGEVIAYAILDIYSRAVLCIWLVHACDGEKIPAARFSDSWTKVRSR